MWAWKKYFYISTFLLVLSAAGFCFEKVSPFGHNTDPLAETNASKVLAASIYKADRMSYPKTNVQ
jgi:hypothetical protein